MHAIAWALPIMGATLIITCSTLMLPLRKKVKNWNPKLGELIICPMCTGFWVGSVASVLGLGIIDGDHNPVLLMFGNGCASAWLNWVSHVSLCAMGQGRYLSARPDLAASDEKKRETT